MTKTGTNIGIGSQGLTWATFGAECLQAVSDLRWMIIFAVILIGADFWWGWRESDKHYKEAKTKDEKEKYKFRFSLAGRRTLNKTVDYLTYLLVGCVAGLAILEPMEVCDHTLSAALGLLLGCAFEISSIFGHVCVVKGIKVKFHWKKFLVALFKRKSEALAEVIDESLEEVDDDENGKEVSDGDQVD